MFTVSSPFLQASYQAIITPCLAAHVRKLCLSCRPKIPCTQGTPRKTLTCRAGCHIAQLQAHGATCGCEKRSLGVQGGPLAGNGHMVPDVAHIFQEAQVLDLVAGSNLQADVTCSAESGCVLRSELSVGITEPYMHDSCATVLHFGSPWVAKCCRKLLHQSKVDLQSNRGCSIFSCQHALSRRFIMEGQKWLTLTLIQQRQHVHVSMGMQARRQLPLLAVRPLLGRDGRVVVPGCMGSDTASSWKPLRG